MYREDINESKNYAELVMASKLAHEKWRLMPAPQRGEIIRNFGNEIEAKVELAKTITEEARKIVTEAEGEFKRQLICVILQQD